MPKLTNKKIIAPIIVIGLLLILVPFHSAKAQLVVNVFGCECVLLDVFCMIRCVANFAFSIPIKLVFFAVAGISTVIAFLTSLFYLLCVAICQWMVDVSILPGLEGQTVLERLVYAETVQRDVLGPITDIANLLIFLFFAFIGLATILRIREYEAKKALVPLIIVALLINFSSLIVLAIANIGTSFTNFFYTEIGGGRIPSLDFGQIIDIFGRFLGAQFYNTFMMNGQFFEAMFFRIDSKGPFALDLAAFALYGFVLTIFFFVAGLVYLAVGIVFIARVVYLFLLIIVAPIAFITFAFRTKTIRSIFPGFLNWDEWWPTLLQWAFIGVPLALWLLVANLLLSAEIITWESWPAQPITVEETDFAQSTTTLAFTQYFSGAMLLEFLKTIAALIALSIGVKTSPGMMREMATKMIDTGKAIITGAVMAVGAVAGAAVLAPAAGGAAGGLSGASQWAGRLAQKGGTLGTLAKPITKPLAMVTRAADVTIGRRFEEYGARARRPPIPKEFETMSTTEQVREVRRTLLGEQRVRMAVVMHEKGKLGEAIAQDPEFANVLARDMAAVGKGPYFKKEVGELQKAMPGAVTETAYIDLKVGKEAQDEAKKEIAQIVKDLQADIRLSPRIEENATQMAQQMKIPMEEARQRVSTDMAARVALERKMTDEEMAKITTKKFWQTSPELMYGIQKYKKGDVLGRAASKFGPEFVEDYTREADERGADWFMMNNQPALIYHVSSPGQRWGYRPPEGISARDVRELATWFREQEEARREKQEREERIRIGMRRMYGR